MGAATVVQTLLAKGLAKIARDTVSVTVQRASESHMGSTNAPLRRAGMAADVRW